MNVVWSERATADLDRIETYLREQSERVADRIWVRIIERVRDQAAMPYAAPLLRDGPWRRLVITRTPYVVLYEITDGALRVEAIFHTSQNF